MSRNTVVGLVSSLTMSAACNSSDALLGLGSDSGMGNEAMTNGSDASLKDVVTGIGVDASGSDSGISGPSCRTDADCAAGQRCGFTKAMGCPNSGVCVEPADAATASCFDPGGRCGCDGLYVDIFCGGADGRTEFTSRPADRIGSCPLPIDGSANDGGPPPSCQPGGNGLTNCGPNSESCCSSPLVPGGTFYRSYDGVTFTDMGNPATVSDFRLDKYEITVGRFRQFVSAVVGGWRPAAGSGKHTHLNGGQGLADSASAGSFETGWNSSWNNNLNPTASGWDANLRCDLSYDVYATWSATAGNDEILPITCTNWYQAYAFCIWDGGFLPSEAEWNYTVSGGSEQRVYPWSNPPSSQTIDCTYANFTTDGDGGAGIWLACVPLAASTPEVGRPNGVGSESPRGDGKWGHADLAGNVYEWTLDWHLNYAVPCSDCVFWGTASQPVSTKANRGGSFASHASSTIGLLNNARSGPVLTSDRNYNNPTMNVGTFGARCARTP